MIEKKKVYVITAIIGVILFFYLLLIYINYDSNKRMMEKLTQTNQISMVKFYKQRLDEWISFKKKIISSTVKSLKDLRPIKDYKEIRTIIQNASTIGDFDSVYIGYDNDVFILSTDEKIPNGYVATQRDWYKVAMESKDTVVTLPYQDAFADKKVLSIVSSFENHEINFKAVLSADLKLDTIQQEILKINKTLQGFAFLIDKLGNIIISPYGSNLTICKECIPAIATILQKKHSSQLQSYKFGNQQYILFYEPLENSDWIFAMTLNENQIFKELNQKFLKNIFVAIIFAVFGIVGFYFFLFVTRKYSSYKRLLDCFAHSTSQAVAIIDLNYKALFLNYLFQEFVPLDNGKKINDTSDKNFKTEEQSILYNKILKSLKEVMEVSQSIKIDKLILPSVSKCLVIQYTPLIVESSRIEGCIVTINDVSHEYILEQQNKTNEQIMLQHSKIAAMGEMLVAITHQWRQPISAMLILAGMIKMNLQDQEEKNVFVYKKTKEIIHIIQFLEQTMHSFKAFYQPQNKRENIHLDHVLQEVMLIMKPISQINNIELLLEYQKNVDYSLISYPNYIKQIVINLISNAKDAICEKSTQDNSYIKILLEQDNGFYCITVQDNGIGISKNFIDKLFQEMQTTKGDKGTGNGLYLCRLLAENKLNGTIVVVSTSNPTIFEIRIKKD